MNHSNSKISIVEYFVIGHTPHDNDMNPVIPQFPGNCPTCPGERVPFIHSNNDFPMRRKYFPLMISELKMSIVLIHNRIAQDPLGPILNRHKATDFMSICIVKDIFDGRAIKEAKTIIDIVLTICKKPIDKVSIVV
uniref:Uncharacterized protein n=1 Tax=Lepeophtheirus salmonis TaxID=72036 RepID=A0A0K2TDM1_LEPSM